MYFVSAKSLYGARNRTIFDGPTLKAPEAQGLGDRSPRAGHPFVSLAGIHGPITKMLRSWGRRMSTADRGHAYPNPNPCAEGLASRSFVRYAIPRGCTLGIGPNSPCTDLSEKSG